MNDRPSPAEPPALAELAAMARPAAWRRRWPRRALLWAALVGLLLVAQTLLVVLTLRYEEARAQDRSDELAAATQGEVRRRMQLALQGLQGLQPRSGDAPDWPQLASALMRAHPEISRIERRDRDVRVLQSADSPFRDPLFAHWPRSATEFETGQACSAARRAKSPNFASSQFIPQPGGLGAEVLDVCVPVQEAGQLVGYTVASIALAELLDQVRQVDHARSHEISFVEADGARLARSGAVRGAGVFVADRVVDLPGATLQLRVDAVERRPRLIPNLATALVMGLSAGLFVVVLLLVRDARRRARAESALAEALAFRKAMEDSLITGLRARDRGGRIVYVNPAFCAMVGYSADELVSSGVPPYWPSDQVLAYQRRQEDRLAGDPGQTPPREGYETEFVRKNGERFPVIVYEAPLVDGAGRHTGWMGAVLDQSAQRRAEDLSRQQQERLQATARLASVGEMASLLSHELNQPLSAIASYATGSLNLLAEPDEQTMALVQQAMGRIAEQAERAGRVIKSVHDFVRRRHQAHELVSADRLIDSVLPLVRLQARKSGVRIALQLPQPAPRVQVDRTMIEQVLLNLARNAIQAMEPATPLDERLLSFRVATAPGAQGRQWVVFSVVDAGPGIPPEVAQQLFTPFFTTKDEGMGLGLSLCRTVVEQHSGAMDFDNLPLRPGQPDGERAGGTEFRFTLPLADPGRRPGSAPATEA